MTLRILLCVFLGGGFGCALRYLLSLVVGTACDGRFPLGTFVVNVAGCLLIGLLSALGAKSLPDDVVKFLVPGFCGGFTTFSTFSKETFALYAGGEHWMAILYVSLSVILGLVAVFLGYTLGERLN